MGMDVFPDADPSTARGGTTKPAKGALNHDLYLHSPYTTSTSFTVTVDADAFRALERHAPALPSSRQVAVESVTAKRFRIEDIEEYARALASRKPFLGRRAPYGASVISDDRKHLRFLLSHASPVDFDDESSWQRHKDHRVEVEGRHPSITEDYRKTLARLQKWRGVSWPSLAEREARPFTRRALPSKEIVGEILSPKTKLGGYRYSNAQRKAALNFVAGTGARPPSEVVELELEDVEWTAKTGEVFTLRDVHDAAFREDVAALDRLTRLANDPETRSLVKLRQPKKKGKHDYVRKVRHAPAWALSATNAPSLLVYVVHHRAKRARALGGLETQKVFVKWSGKPYAGKTPGKGLFQKIRENARPVWKPYTNYSLRGYHARTVLRETGNVYAAASAIGDSVAVAERHYLGDPGENVERFELPQPKRSKRKGATP